MCHFLQAGRRLWKAPLVSQLFPFLWAEPHHADVSLFCEDRSWQNDFSGSHSRITAWVARFLLERSWRTVSVARYLTNVSVCFIQLSKNESAFAYQESQWLVELDRQIIFKSSPCTNAFSRYMGIRVKSAQN